MFNVKREDTLNTLLDNAAACGATDLMAIAIEQGANGHKNQSNSRALNYCIDTGNREGFDLLIQNNAAVSHQHFNNSSLYKRKHYGKNIEPDVQQHFISTLLTYDMPNSFSGKNHRSECCLINIIDYARDDIFTLLDDAIDLTSLLKHEDITPFINRLSNRSDDKDAFRALLTKLLERYRPLTFPQKEGDDTGYANEASFANKLFQFNMSSYLRQLDAAGEITLHRKQVLSAVDSVDDLSILIDTNPNIRLSEYALNDLLQRENINALTPEAIAKLVLHTEPNNYYRTLSLDKTLDWLASNERIDLIKAAIDAATSLSELFEQRAYDMIYRAFKALPSDSQAITFLNNMLSQKQYRDALTTRWTPETNTPYSYDSCMADWLIVCKDKPGRLSALLGILPITEHVFTRYIHNISERKNYDENTLNGVHLKPYLLNTILKHEALSDELKDAFRKTVSYQFSYAERTPTSSIKMLNSNKKLSSQLRSELVARFLIATPSEQRDAFVTFRQCTKTIMMMIQMLEIPPFSAMTEFPLNTEVQRELLKQTY